MNLQVLYMEDWGVFKRGDHVIDQVGVKYGSFKPAWQPTYVFSQ